MAKQTRGPLATGTNRQGMWPDASKGADAVTRAVAPKRDCGRIRKTAKPQVDTHILRAYDMLQTKKKKARFKRGLLKKEGCKFGSRRLVDGRLFLVARRNDSISPLRKTSKVTPCNRA